MKERQLVVAMIKKLEEKEKLLESLEAEQEILDGRIDNLQDQIMELQGKIDAATEVWGYH